MDFLNFPEISGKIINLPAKIFKTNSVYVILSSYYIYYTEAAAEHRNMKQSVI